MRELFLGAGVLIFAGLFDERFWGGGQVFGNSRGWGRVERDLFYGEYKVVVFVVYYFYMVCDMEMGGVKILL